MIKSFKGAVSYFRGSRTLVPLGGDFSYTFPESLKSQVEAMQKFFSAINKNSETNLLRVSLRLIFDLVWRCKLNHKKYRFSNPFGFFSSSSEFVEILT